MKSIQEIMAVNLLTKFESPLERKIAYEANKYGIKWEANYPVEKCRIDIAFPDYKVGLEIDGEEWHSSPEQREHDRKRDKFLASQGWKIERVEGWFCYRHPELTVLKALRHVKDVHETVAYKHALALLVAWNYNNPEEEKSVDDLPALKEPLLKKDNKHHAEREYVISPHGLF